MHIGTITSREKGTYQWTIENFSEGWRNQWLFKSPKFTYNGLEFYIYIDRTWDENLDFSFSAVNTQYDHLYIHSKIRKKLKRMCITFQLRTDCNAESELHVAIWDEFKSFVRSVNFEEYLSRNTHLPLQDHLTILFCMRELNGQGENVSENATKHGRKRKKSEYKSERENGYEKSENETLKKLQKDFEKLLLSKEDTDVTLKVHSEEFLAHRAILRARSPVFYAMFSHEMLERRSGVVTISDCDPKIFADFLMYLYTGNTQYVSEKNVCPLYTLSDKYEVEELKKKCSEFMKSHVSVETFCDYISLALKHAEKELISKATNFFCRRAVEITKTVKWQKFLQENLTVGNELFQKALLKQNNV